MQAVAGARFERKAGLTTSNDSSDLTVEARGVKNVDDASHRVIRTGTAVGVVRGS
jgi:hypothetical protein